MTLREQTYPPLISLLLPFHLLVDMSFDSPFVFEQFIAPVRVKCVKTIDILETPAAFSFVIVLYHDHFLGCQSSTCIDVSLWDHLHEDVDL